jgi:hypothetical protein
MDKKTRYQLKLRQIVKKSFKVFKMERGSERRKSEHRKVRTSKVFKDDQNVKRSERRKSECQKER